MLELRLHFNGMLSEHAQFLLFRSICERKVNKSRGFCLHYFGMFKFNPIFRELKRNSVIVIFVECALETKFLIKI